jgi:hypothetical protein
VGAMVGYNTNHCRRNDLLSFWFKECNEELYICKVEYYGIAYMDHVYISLKFSCNDFTWERSLISILM